LVAVQFVVFDEVHDNVEDWPTVIALGEALKARVGAAGGGGGGVVEPLTRLTSSIVTVPLLKRSR
jgi:hypothetical protein